MGHKFLSTAVTAVTARDRRKKIIVFFTFYDFLSEKNDLREKFFSKFLD
jgi:hypothetical protein